MAVHTFALLGILLGVAPLRASLQPLPACRSAISATSAGDVPDVRWIAPDEARERERLDAWCSAVGPAVVSQAAASTAAPARELAIVTWNVHLGAGDLVELVRQLREGTLTRGQPVRHFVLLVQEAYRGGRYVPADWQPSYRAARRIRPDRPRQAPGDIVATALALNLAVFYAPSMRNGHSGHEDEDRGNAILSTERLENLGAIELPFERQRRVALQASVSVRTETGQPLSLHVTNAHLESMGAPHRVLLFTMFARLKQARFLRRWLPTAGPAVLGGDLNTWLGFGEPAYRALVGTLPQQTFSERRATFAWARLDHLILRTPDDWSVDTIRLPKFGSDHHPLLARIRIESP